MLERVCVYLLVCIVIQAVKACIFGGRLCTASAFGCRNFIVPMDLEFFMPPEKIPHALKVLDVDGDGKISLTDMRDAVIQVHICRHPAHTSDMKSAAYIVNLAPLEHLARRLHHVLGSVVDRSMSQGWPLFCLQICLYRGWHTRWVLLLYSWQLHPAP